MAPEPAVQPRAVERVSPNQLPLLAVQPPHLMQHLAGDEDFAEVVDHRAEAEKA